MPRSQCFAEKRGDVWRGRYPDADGRMRSTSGHPTRNTGLGPKLCDHGCDLAR